MSKMFHVRSFVLAAACAAAAGGSLAGTVEVRYDANATFTDAGSTPVQREARLGALGKHLQALGERLLPAGQSLTVDIVDLDMAGTPRVGARANDLRIVRGMVDWPRIELRYTLSEQGRVLRSEQEQVSDMEFRSLAGFGSNANDGLRYEKQALTKWFTKRFASAPGVQP